MYRHTLTQLGISQDVEGGKLGGVDALEAEDLDRGAGEAALGGLGGSLHEEHDRRGADGVLDGLLRLVGDEAVLGEEGERGPEGDWARRRPDGLPCEILRKDKHTNG